MKPQKIALQLLLAAGVFAAAGCSSKSPSEPSGGSRSPVPPPPAAPTFSISVTANPGQLTVGTGSTSTINVRIVNSSTGAPAPDATPVALSTTLGNFSSSAGPQAITLQTVGGQASAVLFPGTSVGTATITATATPVNGTASGGAANVRINAAGTFFLSSVTPSIGNATGGDTVVINGGGFAAPARVTFNGTPGQVVSITPSTLTVITPSAAAAGVTVGVGQTASVPVGVTIFLNTPNQASDTLTNGFTYSLGGQPQQPQVFSVNPASGPDNGGTKVTIVGQGFQAPVQVFFGTGTAGAFNGVEASVLSVTATQLVVLTPSASGFGQNNVDQVVDLLVKNVNSGFSTVAPQAFKYGSSVLVTSISPTQTQWNQPVKVTLFGQGFQSPVAVGLAGFAANVLQTAGTEIQVLSGVPVVSACNNITGPSNVVNINNGQGANGPAFTYIIDRPAVASLSPSSGPQNGGTTVTLFGINFDNPASVIFGTEAAFVTSQSCDNQGNCMIKVTVPPFTGTFPTQPCTLGGEIGTMNIPTSVNVMETNVATTCTSTLPLAFTYNPSDVSCHVAPPTPPKASFTFSTAPGSLDVIFNDTSTGTVNAWTWDFGDASAQVHTQNPTHLYAVAGTYTVTLTVTGPGGSSSVSEFVTVPGT